MLRRLAPSVLALGCGAAAAAPTLLVENDRLMGANNVLVAGELFDVRFVDGSFTNLFVDASGLDATTAAAAELFSIALGEQVFGDDGVFDRDSGKVNGCTNAWRPWCYVYTPWQDNVGQQLNVGYFFNANPGARNGSWPVFDSVGFTATGRWVDTGSYSVDHGDYVYADWSRSLVAPPGGNVPEPGALGLAALALTLLGLRRRG